MRLRAFRGSIGSLSCRPSALARPLVQAVKLGAPLIRPRMADERVNLTQGRRHCLLVQLRVGLVVKKVLTVQRTQHQRRLDRSAPDMADANRM